MQHADTIHIELPAKYENLALIRALLAAIMEKSPDVDQLADLKYNIQIATHEICLNIIQHAYGHEDGRIRMMIELKLDERSIQIYLYDSGRSFDINDIVDPDLDEPQAHGYGLFIAKQLMDTLEYHPSQETNHWRLQKQF